LVCRELGIFINKTLTKMLDAGCFQACSPEL